MDRVLDGERATDVFVGVGCHDAEQRGVRTTDLAKHATAILLGVATSTTTTLTAKDRGFKGLSESAYCWAKPSVLQTARFLASITPTMRRAPCASSALKLPLRRRHPSVPACFDAILQNGCVRAPRLGQKRLSPS